MTDIYTIRTDDKKQALPKSGALIFGGDELRVRFDAALFPRGIGINLHADPVDTRIGLLARFGLFSLSARVESKAFRHVPEGGIGASIDWSEDELWAHWSPAVMGERCVDLLQLAFGEQKHERVIREAVVTDLLLPERPYPCTVTLLDVVTWRERAPVFTRAVMPAAEVRFAKPPRFPGKGESSDDLEEDYIAEMFQPGMRSVSEAVAEAYARVMKLREERASRTWVPDAKAQNEAPGRVTEHVVMPGEWSQLEAFARLLGTNLGHLRLYRAMSGDTTVGAAFVIRVAKMPSDDALRYVVTSRLLESLATLTGATVDRVRVVLHIGSDRFLAGGGTLYEVKTHGQALARGPFDISSWPGSISAFLP